MLRKSGELVTHSYPAEDDISFGPEETADTPKAARHYPDGLLSSRPES